MLLLRDGSFRIPSCVCISSSSVMFGQESRPDRCERYESIKMQAAAEASGQAHYYFGPANRFPTSDGFSAVDLATLAIWFMISEGHRGVSAYLPGSREGFALGMTMGVPMAFFDDDILRPLFLLMARRAWHLYRESGPIGSNISIAEARGALSAVASISLPDIPNDQVRDWIRSEGEAAMWWPFQSPAVPAGRYVKLDIGAGTSHASLFQIYGDNATPKLGIAFSGAIAVPVGMDAIDSVLARCMGSNGHSSTLRGQEESILQGNLNAVKAIGQVQEDIYHAYRKAWMDTEKKIRNSPAELHAWRDHRMFAIGGGSLVSHLIDPMRRHPSGANPHVQLAPLEIPADFTRMDGSAIRGDELPFASVAYGLSNIGLSIPEVSTPREVPIMPDRAERRILLDRDDIYAK